MASRSTKAKSGESDSDTSDDDSLTLSKKDKEELHSRVTGFNKILIECANFQASSGWIAADTKKSHDKYIKQCAKIDNGDPFIKPFQQLVDLRPSILKGKENCLKMAKVDLEDGADDSTPMLESPSKSTVQINLSQYYEWASEISKNKDPLRATLPERLLKSLFSIYVVLDKDRATKLEKSIGKLNKKMQDKGLSVATSPGATTPSTATSDTATLIMSTPGAAGAAPAAVPMIAGAAMPDLGSLFTSLLNPETIKSAFAALGQNPQLQGLVQNIMQGMPAMAQGMNAPDSKTPSAVISSAMAPSSFPVISSAVGPPTSVMPALDTVAPTPTANGPGAVTPVNSLASLMSGTIQANPTTSLRTDK
jgi:hypothetical protein